ncbi:MAG: hypothetical protein HN768_03355, partial [Rhodospirillaceae bacterium]|nr:hypothetical protein [Rhodospirillaceae bacterium]
LNLKSKSYQETWAPMEEVEAERRAYLTKEKRIKAVTVAFTDLEGRMHMLDYDKKYLLDADQFTFDGSWPVSNPARAGTQSGEFE